jgi:hypothetical protein
MSTADPAFEHTRTDPMIWLAVPLAVLMLAPLLIYPEPYLQDYPNHFARTYIALNRTDDLLSRHYEYVWSAEPNMGWDIWMYLIGKIMPLAYAGKLFIAATFAITLSGALILHRALCGRATPFLLLTLPFFYNSAYQTGFLGFILGFGVSLWAMAMWLWLLKRPWAGRLVASSLAAVLLCFIHIYAFAIYGLFVAAVVLADATQENRWRQPVFIGSTLRDAIQAVPALALIAAGSLGGQAVATGSWRWPFMKIDEIPRLIDVGPLLPSLAFLGVAIAIGLYVATVYGAGLQRRAAFAAATFGIAFLALPGELFGGYHTDWRMLLPLAWLLIVGCCPQRTPGKISQRAIAAALIVLIAAMTGFQVSLWRASAEAHEDFRQIVATVPRGASIYWAHGNLVTHREVEANAVGAYHVASRAVVSHHALVSTMFAIEGQHPLRFQSPRLRHLRHNATTLLEKSAELLTSEDVAFKDHVLNFDFALVLGPISPDGQALLPYDRMHLEAEVGDFQLFTTTGEQ